MKTGLQLPSFTWPGGPEAIGPTLARVVRAADDVGFDSIWVMDHFFQIRGVGRPEEPMLEGWTALGFMAAHSSRARLGLMVGMVSVVMLFITFSSTFLFRHHIKRLDSRTGNYISDWTPLPLPYGLLLLNTAILLLGSFTIEKGRRQAFEQAVVAPITALPGIAAERGWRVPWVGITALLGLTFLAGQALAWRQLTQRGYLLASNPANSFFYLLTGLHALHLLGGVLALGYAVLTGFLPRPLQRKRVVVDVAAWYWHFMGMLWVYVFAVIALG